MNEPNPRIGELLSQSAEAGELPALQAAAMERKTWIELVAQQLSILRPSAPHDEIQALVARMWGSSSHLGPMTAAALLDRMLARRDGEEPSSGRNGS
jgi:hypothetical protein